MEICGTEHRWHRRGLHLAPARDTSQALSNEYCRADKSVDRDCEPSDAERKLVDAYKDLRPVPFQPPWAVLPWLQAPLPRPIIKQVVRSPDITATGRIFDLFI